MSLLSSPFIALDHQFVRWERVADDMPLQGGDIWSSHDPNTSENCQMKPIRHTASGLCPGENHSAVTIGNDKSEPRHD